MDWKRGDAVDLNPAGYLLSQGFGIYNGQEVGTAANSGPGIGHAMLWSGSAASAIDFNPTWATTSAANAIDNDQQVGMAASPSSTRCSGPAPRRAQWIFIPLLTSSHSPPAFPTSSRWVLAG